MMQHLKLSVTLVAILLVHLVTSTPVATPETDCPEDCTCSLAQHTHKPLLHLKCSSTKGLKSYEKPVVSAIPIHSIDLSYSGLTRVGHVLDVLPDITSVDLSHNELHETGHLSKRIKKVNLKHNRLTSAKLAKLPQHLQVLNLQHNDITYLPIELTHLHHLKQLELSHNAINCSCSTLEVRNWLQERSVYMEHPVVCTYPLEARGKSWLQLKQQDICAKEQQHKFSDDNDENELMMGDQPLDVSTEHEEEEELGKYFLTVDKTKAKSKKVARSPANEDLPDVEGSGDLSEMNMELIKAKELATEAPITQQPSVEHIAQDPAGEEDEDDAEGSGGSGGGALVIPSFAKIPLDENDEFDNAPSEEQKPYDNEFDQKPIEGPSPSIFKDKNMGIFEGAQKEDGEQEQPQIDEDVIVPVVETKLDTGVVTDGPLDNNSKESEDILAAKMGKHDDSSAIYYLLTVIALIIVGLILFVAIKRCKYDSNQAARDAEAQRQTELLDMDKKQLGKPLHKNGQEHSPLIGEKTKLDEAQIVNGNGTKKPYDTNDVKDAPGQQQPLLNGNGAPANGKEIPSIHEPTAAAPHEYYPITPRYPTPQSPRASKYAQHPQQAGVEPNNNDVEPDGNGSYPLPSSPKSGRYSPVYSPETGRVKIKLTETPRPKTPMLVTRSKSNAGDIITTPVTQPVVVNGH